MSQTTLAALGLPPPPIIVGHRGACALAPENTLRSFALAIEQGADMIELDLHLTADGVLITSHDCNLKRTAGVDVNIEQTPYDALRDIDVSKVFGGSEPATMPRLEDVLAAIPPAFPLNLELKRESADVARYVEALSGELTRDRLLISSFDWDLLRAVRARLPELPLAPIADRNAAQLAAIAAELQAVSAHCNERTITGSIVGRCAVPILVYTVNEVEVAKRMFTLGVAGVFSNDPGALVRHFRGQSATVRSNNRSK